MTAPVVSFFVQCYNTGKWAGECLRSILEQSGNFDFEVIVIDDSSKDDTADVIASFVDPRIRFVRHTQNVGAIATANEGYAATRGKYLIRIDSDDRLRPQFLERTVPILESNPKVGFVYGDIATMDLNSRLTCEGKMVQRNGRPTFGDEFFPLLMNNFVPAPTTLIRREALLLVLPVPPQLSFLDWYITTAIAENWLMYFIDEVLADYRVYPGNQHSSMIYNRTGEHTIFIVLDALFADGRRAEEKRMWQKRVYASQYLQLADNYFGCEMNRDARRCYLAAVRRNLSQLMQSGVFRRLLATYLPRQWYDSTKRVVKGGAVTAA
jgi:glycosyltransferase involved in cell wall biosynthesis